MTETQINLIRDALLSAHAAVVRSVNARSRKAQLANGRIASDHIEYALATFQRAVAPPSVAPESAH